MNTGPHLPELILEITNACHHRCIHCSTVGGLPIANELSQAERLSVLRQACEMGLEEIRLLGGDPLFRMNDSVELLVEANRLGVSKALIYTSAAERQLQWMTTFAGLTPIHISAEASIYSADEATHDGITAKAGSLDRLLANSREAARVGFDLNWNFVWMKPNFADLESVVNLAARIGIKRVRVLRLMLNGRAADNHHVLALPVKLQSQTATIMGSVAARYPSVHIASSKTLDFQLATGRTAPCSAGTAQLVVQADGDALPCIGLKGMTQFIVGNVRSSSLRDLFLRCQAVPFASISTEFHECPAILFKNQPELVQLTLKGGEPCVAVRI